MGSKFVIDFQNYKETTSAHVKPGIYRVAVEDVDHFKSSGNDSRAEAIEVHLRIVGGDFDGMTLVERLFYIGKDGKPSRAMFRVVGFMDAIGLKWSKKRMQLDGDAFIGRQLDVEVNDGEPYQGRVSSEVRSFIRIPDAERPASKENDLDLVEEPAPAPSPVSGADSPEASPAPVQAAQPETIPQAPSPQSTGLGEAPEELTLEELNL